jgi:NAD+ synthase
VRGCEGARGEGARGAKDGRAHGFILQALGLSIALAQLNPTVGDVAGNLARVRRARDRATELGADLVVFSELVLVGYPPEDLVLRPALVEAAASALGELERESASGPALLVTLPWRVDGCLHNSCLHNTVALVADGRSELRFKHELPNYGVFDEKRIFNAGPMPAPVVFRGVRLGLPICEDIWFPAVTQHLAHAGAELLLVPNGSPFEAEKFEERIELARARTSESRLPIAYVNQVGGQDELVFDGGSFVMNADGTLAHVLPFWEETIVLTTWEKTARGFRCIGPALSEPGPEQPRLESIYRAMMLGLRDYVRKNGFTGIVLGLSGGIDSALTAAVAVDALGADRVRGVRLPSRFTSDASMTDAADSAARLGIRLDTLNRHSHPSSPAAFGT